MKQIVRFGVSLGLALLLTACGPDIGAWDNTTADNGITPNNDTTADNGATPNNSVTPDNGGGADNSSGTGSSSRVEIAVSKHTADTHALAFSVRAPRTATTWHWDFGDGASANGASVTHNYASDGRYTVTVTSPDHSTSASTSVTINSAPVAAFSGAIGDDRTIHLNAGASSDEGGKITTYHWIFGDGTEGDGKTVTHRYAASGDYDVTLIVTDDLGGTANITQRYNVTVAPLRIVAIGDSITQANSEHNSYRYELWKLLKEQGVSFDFVGSHATNYGGNPNRPTLADGSRFDPDNEGHWGWQADQILDGIGTWLKGYDANIALIHIGTNDLIKEPNESVEQTAAEIRAIIEKLRADNPDITILLSNLIPFKDAPSKLQQLNARIETLATEEDNDTSHVFFVDQNTGYSVEYNYDGIHPNETGERRMAGKWFGALVANGLI